MVCFNLPFGSLHPNSVDQNMLFQSNWAAQKQHQVLLEPSACHPAKQSKTKIVKRMWIKLNSAFLLLLHYTSFIYWHFFICFFLSNFDDIGNVSSIYHPFTKRIKYFLSYFWIFLSCWFCNEAGKHHCNHFMAVRMQKTCHPKKYIISLASLSAKCMNFMYPLNWIEDLLLMQFVVTIIINEC